ncbi:MAG: hypothetical protein M1282_18140, partial [Chloroflexi bacterium]|nr:hypothetical protein [Chloroflexota bacterium]
PALETTSATRQTLCCYPSVGAAMGKLTTFYCGDTQKEAGAFFYLPDALENSLAFIQLADHTKPQVGL